MNTYLADIKQRYRVSLLLLSTLIPLCVNAQWTKQDSLRLKRMLESDEEIILNKNAINSISLDPLSSMFGPITHKNHLEFDNTLPAVYEEEEVEAPVRLSLRVYSSKTKYNYDPVNQKKIDVGRKVYRVNFASLTREGMPATTYGALNNTRFMMMNGTVNGSISCNFDKIVSKRFWQFRAKKNTKRTLEILEQYSDSAQIWLK